MVIVWTCYVVTTTFVLRYAVCLQKLCKSVCIKICLLIVIVHNTFRVFHSCSVNFIAELLCYTDVPNLKINYKAYY